MPSSKTYTHIPSLRGYNSWKYEKNHSFNMREPIHSNSSWLSGGQNISSRRISEALVWYKGVLSKFYSSSNVLLSSYGPHGFSYLCHIYLCSAQNKNSVILADIKLQIKYKQYVDSVGHTGRNIAILDMMDSMYKCSGRDIVQPSSSISFNFSKKSWRAYLNRLTIKGHWSSQEETTYKHSRIEQSVGHSNLFYIASRTK